MARAGGAGGRRLRHSSESESANSYPLPAALARSALMEGSARLAARPTCFRGGSPQASHLLSGHCGYTRALLLLPVPARAPL